MPLSGSPESGIAVLTDLIQLHIEIGFPFRCRASKPETPNHILAARDIMSCITKLFERNLVRGLWALGLILVGATLTSSGFAQTSNAPAAPVQPPAAASSATARPHTRYTPNHFPKRAVEYYSSVWGVDSLVVRAVESGKLVRFSFRVLDPVKAAILNDKKFEAFLDSPDHGIRLVIPSLEKVGQLRQTNTPEAGRSYWMAFSNPQRTVMKGDRVNVVIGRFHADGLVVE
jgi:hypothetical protein